MNVRKFIAQSSREAMQMVREALGTDAVILSNRAVAGGNEIVALGSEDMHTLLNPEAEKLAAPLVRPVSKGQQAHDVMAQQTQLLSAMYARQPAADKEQGPMPKTLQKEQAVTSPKSVLPPAAQQTSASQELRELMSEIRSMRSIVEPQLTELAWNSLQQRDPLKPVLLRSLLAAGFGAGLSRALIEKLPVNLNRERALVWMKSVLLRNIRTIPDQSQILEQGGVFALIGPTGVGKTTTTAKLAARFVMKHGADKLALITTDGYRIGGHEQLRIYGKILGVMVHAVKDAADLQIALKELKNKHTILIDTVGVSQRDRMVTEQIAMLSGPGSNVKRLLCLSATSTGETLSDVVRVYKGKGLAGCILTKLDEAATIGSALDVMIRHKLDLYCVTDGQRVPEDLQAADRKQLIERAFSLSRQASTPYAFRDTELPMLMAHAGRQAEGRGAQVSHE
ncbi:MAG: flagellar biosynthesis protein FlhF [Methylophilaceae bacterium]